MAALMAIFDRRTPAEFTIPVLMTVDFAFAISSSLVRPGRPRYPVFVDWAAALLHAVFRPHLTMTPLRFANPCTAIRLVEDFHLQAVVHTRHTARWRGPPPRLSGPWRSRFAWMVLLAGPLASPSRSPTSRACGSCVRPSGASRHARIRACTHLSRQSRSIS